MAFFAPRAYSPYAPHQPAATEPSFHGLFRLLEDWDNHHNSSENTSSSTDSKQQARPQHLQQPQQQQRQQPRRQQRQQPEQPAYFTPRFDIVETDAAYELYGELPGVDKKDVEIEFSDPQTLIVKGHIERTVSSASAETRDATDEDDAVVIDHAGASTSTAASAAADDHAETSSQRSFRATVEDGEDDDGTATPSSKKADQKTTATSADTTVATTAPSTVATTGKPQQPTHKYWLAERHAGPFSRTFAFPERLDLDGVTASLHNGVLALTVPKARKYEGRRISLL
ncbi:HSP20-like chaperone [Microdochium bolleyi]|uniref:HSP20-like chaperone n=1 Tax=Microdochium bolleyi TaxID=196109 RepID=A0A136JFJ8_9PEZI|nr:HSP20-like chaperone [Microdochium bolleyi]